MKNIIYCDCYYLKKHAVRSRVISMKVDFDLNRIRGKIEISKQNTKAFYYAKSLYLTKKQDVKILVSEPFLNFSNTIIR